MAVPLPSSHRRLYSLQLSARLCTSVLVVSLHSKAPNPHFKAYPPPPETLGVLGGGGWGFSVWVDGGAEFGKHALVAGVRVIGTALSDMEYKVQLFNTYKEGELNLGEACCVDRCVVKYNQVNNMIGQLLAYGKHRM
ncbi:hypothetical protein KSS87_006834 [Heliosperma pusillum]|nr:hypothetical protein KSS87_006834 [Heliosperma pusillum]